MTIVESISIVIVFWKAEISNKGKQQDKLETCGDSILIARTKTTSDGRIAFPRLMILDSNILIHDNKNPRKSYNVNVGIEYTRFC